MSARVPVTHSCSRVVARRITAAGVDGSRPPAASRRVMARSASTPMRTTRVSTAPANRSHSTVADLLESSWPVTTAKEEDSPRWVNGMPAAPAAAMADDTPGTTSTGIPAARQASASSPPRPNTKGSPPLSLTTSRPAPACSTSSPLITDWARQWRRADLPAKTRRARGGASSRSSGLTSWSYTTTSACRSQRSPRSVISSGSPGPAPSRMTRPQAASAANLISGEERVAPVAAGPVLANRERRATVMWKAPGPPVPTRAGGSRP